MGKTVYEDMRRMEELIRNSEVDWTIVRPSGAARRRLRIRLRPATPSQDPRNRHLQEHAWHSWSCGGPSAELGVGPRRHVIRGRQSSKAQRDECMSMSWRDPWPAAERASIKPVLHAVREVSDDDEPDDPNPRHDFDTKAPARVTLPAPHPLPARRYSLSWRSPRLAERDRRNSEGGVWQVVSVGIRFVSFRDRPDLLRRMWELPNPWPRSGSRTSSRLQLRPDAGALSGVSAPRR